MVKELWPIASGLNRLFVPYSKLCEETSKNDESFDLMRFYLANVLPLADNPAKAREKHVTIAGYFVFARQEEEHGY
ncbi:molybdenum cofactor biosynthesis protein [Citrobacter werkmanii]|nr:molybdenum cofactor biosynthesis protein [Citrobacter werkmanii]OSP21230.1 molybdenum cofactor biosynthesis protein [Citrobacter werkmanii]